MQGMTKCPKRLDYSIAKSVLSIALLVFAVLEEEEIRGGCQPEQGSDEPGSNSICYVSIYT